jgi:hypothetical protein
MMGDIIQTSQDDKSNHANDRGNDRANGQDLLCLRIVAHQAPTVSKPALGDECQCECHYCGCSCGDEKGLELMGADI